MSLAAACLALLLFLMVRHSLIDDVYISLSYARNLAFHFHWGLIPQETTNSATSPLNVLTVAGLSVVLRDPIWALGVLYITCNALFAWFITRTAGILNLPIASAAVAVALVMLNPFMLSALGMEATTLAVALIGALLYYTVQGRPLAFGVVSGLALLTRLDLIIFVVLLALLNPSIRRKAWVSVVAIVAVCGPWFGFSWVYFGSAIPDTYIIKTLQTWDYSYLTGALFYGSRDWPAVIVSFAAPALGMLTMVRWTVTRFQSTDSADARRFDPVGVLGAAGIAYFIAYVFLDVPPYIWYYGPVIIALSISCALLAPRVWTRVRRGERSTQWAWSVAGVALIAIVLAECVVVGRHAPSWREAVIIGNDAPSSDYERAAIAIRAQVGNATVTAPVEIGALAYFCQCAIVDNFSDRGLLVPIIERQTDEGGPLKHLLLGLNYALLDPNVLPRQADFDLALELGPAKGPRQWETHSTVAGVRHLELTKTRVDPRVVARWSRRVIASLPPGHLPVNVDWGGGQNARNYQIALVRDLHRRGVNAWIYRQKPLAADLIVATAGDIERFLARGDQFVAYGGAVSWNERVEIKRRIKELSAQHEAGELTDLDFLVKFLDLRNSLGLDVALFRRAD